MRRLKAVSRWTWPSPVPAAPNAFWKSPFEAVARPGVCPLLEKRGWSLLSVHGSHHIYGKAGSIVRLTVPIHGNHPLKTGLLRHLMKLAEISEDDMK
ncbi:MAG: type II toxin-antitoxin system HicA family toxin [Rhizomicrobium sp.]